MKKQLAFFTLLVLFSLLVAACGITSAPAPAQEAAEPTQALAEEGAQPAGGSVEEEAVPEEEAEPSEEIVEEAAQPAEDTELTELIVGVAADNYRLEGDGADLGIRPPAPANITEPLVRITTDYKIVPWLAESWEVVAENTWRFNLRQGVKFHNGDEFDAEAAKWSIDKPNRWFPLFPPEEVRVVDTYTLEIVTSRPFWYVAEALSHPSYAMYSPNGDPGSSPIGTGPFRLDEYQ